MRKNNTHENVEVIEIKAFVGASRGPLTAHALHNSKMGWS